MRVAILKKKTCRNSDFQIKNATILKEVVLTSNGDFARAGFDVAYTHVKKCLFLSHRNVGKQLFEERLPTERRFLEEAVAFFATSYVEIDGFTTLAELNNHLWELRFHLALRLWTPEFMRLSLVTSVIHGSTISPIFFNLQELESDEAMDDKDIPFPPLLPESMLTEE